MLAIVMRVKLPLDRFLAQCDPFSGAPCTSLADFVAGAPRRSESL